MIPKIVHIIWLTDKNPNSLPNIFDAILKHNKEMNLSFEFKLWMNNTDDKNCYSIEKLIKNEYPQIYDIFIKCKLGVQKADIARQVLLHKYGGIYIDLDILCLKPFDDLIDFFVDDVILSMEPAEQTMKIFNSNNIICNAFIASPPKHPIIDNALNKIYTIYNQHGERIFQIFNIFGSDLVASSLNENNVHNKYNFINRNLVYPINDVKFDDLSCSETDVKMLKDGKYGDSFLVHYWIHSNFEAKHILDNFIFDNDKTIHENVFLFFKSLYPNNKYLKSI